ncbi:MAG: ATP-grasp domain-containing protein [Acidobacteriia bacterium]|nr:ATP-grasp domain-containing protein [Terriglobia bacterium]
MVRSDCIILYNAATLRELPWSEEKVYPANLIREEVGAIEESLRELGYSPYVLAVDQFSKDLVLTFYRMAPRFVWNLCEEIQGDCNLEMCIAGMLELMNIPYTGSGPLALGLALNKFRVKQVLQSTGIPVPRGYLCALGQRLRPRAKRRFPVIVKPVHEDASLGINSKSVCHDLAQLQKQVAYIHDVYQQDALVDEYLEGREFNVAVLGDREPQALPISEIDFSRMPADEPRIVSYRAKWDEESIVCQCTVPVCPAEIPARLENRIKLIALRSSKCIGCRDYARIDMRTDADGNIYVLEVNPNPDLSPQAGFVRAARAAGMTYTDLVARITQSALERGTKVPTTAYACS